jgi:hypothetical protein
MFSFLNLHWMLCRTYLILMEIKYMASAPFQYGWVKVGLVFNINMFLLCKISYKFIIIWLCLIYFGQVFWICIALLEIAYGVALSVGVAACCSWSKLISVICSVS